MGPDRRQPGRPWLEVWRRQLGFARSEAGPQERQPATVALRLVLISLGLLLGAWIRPRRSAGSAFSAAVFHRPWSRRIVKRRWEPRTAGLQAVTALPAAKNPAAGVWIGVIARCNQLCFR